MKRTQDLKHFLKLYLETFNNKRTKNNIKCILNVIPENATLEDLEAIIKNWATTLNKTTTKQYCTILKTFLSYYAKQTKDFSFDELEIPKINVIFKSKFTLTPMQIDDVKSFARTYDNSKGIATLVIFLCENGSRIAEALEILSQPEKFQQNANNNYYVVQPALKNNNERAYIIRHQNWDLYKANHDKAKMLYRNYDVVRKPLEKFIEDLKEHYPALKKELITTHTFRRSYVTNQHEAGFSIVDIQKSTGHRDVNTIINSYILPNNERLVQYVERATDPERLKNLSINDMKHELNTLRDFREKALLNEKKYTTELELKRLEKEEALLEVKRLKQENERLRRLLEN
ncbi:tyrosine-type recombinase/integrase [Mycoplasma sp. VS292A]|uniref:tyrosine-type recombinase/integrase n=1 Tax=Mycoplasma sp. VS292A TaxID=3401680 RepID=UPI003AAFB717